VVQVYGLSELNILYERLRSALTRQLAGFLLADLGLNSQYLRQPFHAGFYLNAAGAGSG